jgi:hypothetical protein
MRTTIAATCGWPEVALPVLERAITVEYTSLTRAEAPVTMPVTPYLGHGAGTLAVSTGVTYPAKAERARRNPKVCLLYADHVGSGLADPPVVLVQGLATVRDADLQANTDRYVSLTLAKLPEAFKGMPPWMLRRLAWYFARIWIEVTPTRIWWWDAGAPDREPGEWVAPAGTTAPPSDPAPPGRQPAAWLAPPAEWRSAARHAVARLEHRDLSWVGTNGFPVSIPVVVLHAIEHGFRLRLGRRPPEAPQGLACLTFHAHTPRFTQQENHTLVGVISSDGLEGEFRVERLLADVSLTGNKLVRTLGFLAKGRRLAPRLRSEASRRGQAVPGVRLP